MVGSARSTKRAGADNVVTLNQPVGPTKAIDAPRFAIGKQLATLSLTATVSKIATVENPTSARVVEDSSSSGLRVASHGVTVNMAGLPGIAVPAGLDPQGLPLGLQLIGRPFDEETLFALSEVIEQAAGRFPIPSRWWAGSPA